MRLLLLIAILALVIGCSKTPPVERIPVSVELLLWEHNLHREAAGKPLFVKDASLEEYAQSHAEWMARRDWLKHSSLDLPGWSTMGENIAWGQRSEKQATDDWMDSPGHRRNILNSQFEFIGFGYGYAKNGQIYWCAVFGGGN